MKKSLLILLTLLLAATAARAVPADPTPRKYRQPDGSVIVIRQHGDEFFHWTTDADGRIVELCDDGFYRPVSQEALQQRQRRGIERRAEQQVSRWSSYDEPFETNFGDRKVLCLIANFTDSTFIVENPRQHFSDLLNQEGYNYQGSIGSVRDYYLDNSWNGTESLYRPQFDVYGPVNLSHSSAYYDSEGVSKAILEAYELMKEQIPIADYDTNGNGNIDMVLFYYPGHNEAEGAGKESIWPHQGTGNYGTMGGKNLVRYFCTSELYGASGTQTASIGTTCHEFAHSLGLPDFYDTDYEKNGYNTFTLGSFDLMSGGNYNLEGRYPPNLNVVERNMLGWVPAPEPISASGEYTLPAVHQNRAYRFDTQVAGEYFVLESRDGSKWDAPLPKGLLVYHLDKSNRVISGAQSAAYLWDNTNKINVYGGHPCFFLAPSTATPNNAAGDYIFPGNSGVTSFIPTDVDGNYMGLVLDDIAFNGSASTFSVTVYEHRTVFGYVTDTFGVPLAGARVSLTPSDVPFNAAPSLLSGSLFCEADANGYYSFTLEDNQTDYQILQVSLDGYVSVCYNLTLTDALSSQDIVLFRKGEGVSEGLWKYDGSKSLYNLGIGNRAAGCRYSAAELSALHATGTQLSEISFMGHGKPGEFSKVYVLVLFGNELVLRRDVTDLYKADQVVNVDIRDAQITIPEDKALFFGYGFTDIASGTYPYLGFGPMESNDGACACCADFMGENPICGGITFGSGDSPFYFGFLTWIKFTPSVPVSFSELGVSYLQLQEDVPAVAVAAGKSLRSITWKLDGEAVDTPPARSTLAAGSHTYMARILYNDGTAERVYLDVVVE